MRVRDPGRSSKGQPTEIDRSLSTTDRTEAWEIIAAVKALHLSETDDFDLWNIKRLRRKEGLRSLVKAPPRYTVADAREEYVSTMMAMPHIARTKTDDTITREKNVTNRFVQTLPAGLLLVDLNRSHIEAFVFRDGIKRSTATTQLSRIKALLRWCVEKRYLAKSPAAGFNIDRRYTCTTGHLTLDMYHSFLRFLDDWEKKKAGYFGRNGLTYVKNAVRLSVETGFRRAEICNLRWEDVDLGNGVGSVYARCDDHRRTKSGRERRVSLPESAMQWLTDLKDKSACGGTGYVIEGPKGGQLKKDTLSNAILRYRKRAGLPRGIKFHSMRHTHATWLAEKNVSPFVIQERLGHSSIRATQKIYVHPAHDASQPRVDAAFASLAQ